MKELQLKYGCNPNQSSARVYMKDGSVIRCNNYFVEDPETHTQSELVFNDRQELTHISFADAGEASGMAATELTAQAAPIREGANKHPPQRN